MLTDIPAAFCFHTACSSASFWAMREKGTCNKAAKSFATPTCDAASPRFAVKPISITSSLTTPKYSAANMPTLASADNTIMPSWLLPIPHSSSAQIIPSDTSPRIFAFPITKGSLPTISISVPTKATTTFCPAATLGAPHTIGSNTSPPTFTVVKRKRSALGCVSHVTTSPITKPFRPEPALYQDSKCSTSKPLTDSKSDIS